MSMDNFIFELLEYKGLPLDRLAGAIGLDCETFIDKLEKKEFTVKEFEILIDYLEIRHLIAYYPYNTIFFS